MQQQLADRAADIGAVASTAGVATYNFTDFLNDTALIVAIISGGLAAAWHIYKFYEEWKRKRAEKQDG